MYVEPTITISFGDRIVFNEAAKSVIGLNRYIELLFDPITRCIGFNFVREQSGIAHKITDCNKHVPMVVCGSFCKRNKVENQKGVKLEKMPDSETWFARLK